VKEKHTKKGKDKDELRAEYDPSLIRAGMRGKYAEQYRSGTNLVWLAPDVAAAFPNAEAVNEALRLLMKVAEESMSKKP
jgi:hypothetical protein